MFFKKFIIIFTFKFNLSRFTLVPFAKYIQNFRPDMGNALSKLAQDEPSQSNKSTQSNDTSVLSTADFVSALEEGLDGSPASMYFSFDSNEAQTAASSFLRGGGSESHPLDLTGRVAVFDYQEISATSTPMRR